MKLYNTLSHEVEEFAPIDNNKVRMYVCGITPYDTTHLGHAFTYLSFDVLIRYLNYKGFIVKYTQNVTDINDRDNDILKRAREQNTTWQNLAKFWTDKFLTDMKKLNWIMPDNYLWASEHIPEMTELIGKLLDKNIAYKKNGGVYLDIKKAKDFGKLSGLNEKYMLKIAKEFDEDIENTDKRNKLDITLWRPTVENQAVHIPSFDSPLGKGRPGWHLECSGMSISSLGEQIDIHGGGNDLIYPHHESEIAQSEGATGKIPFSKYWIHTGTVSYQGQKMSKSIGNLVLISDLLKKYSPNAIRYLLLSHNYRKDGEFREVDLEEAEKNVEKIKESLSKGDKNETVENDLAGFKIAMENDLNTSKALELFLNSKNTKAKKQIAEILGFKF